MGLFSSSSSESEDDVSKRQKVRKAVEQIQGSLRYHHDLDATNDGQVVECTDCDESYRITDDDWRGHASKTDIECVKSAVADHFNQYLCPGDHRWELNGAFGDTGWGHERVAVQCAECGIIELWQGKHLTQYSGWPDADADGI